MTRFFGLGVLVFQPHGCNLQSKPFSGIVPDCHTRGQLGRHVMIPEAMGRGMGGTKPAHPSFFGGQGPGFELRSLDSKVKDATVFTKPLKSIFFQSHSQTHKGMDGKWCKIFFAIRKYFRHRVSHILSEKSFTFHHRVLLFSMMLLQRIMAKSFFFREVSAAENLKLGKTA